MDSEESSTGYGLDVSVGNPQVMGSVTIVNNIFTKVKAVYVSTNTYLLSASFTAYL